jgi:hypothetical protein
MGFLSSASTLSLTARLTPYGREELIKNGGSTIKYFSLGDSDANYITTEPLTTGFVPSIGGNLSENNSVTNSIIGDYQPTSLLLVNNGGSTYKTIMSDDIKLSSELISIGFSTVSGTNVTHNIINRADYNTNELVNLFSSFGLPINTTEDARYTATTYQNGGFSDTALSGFGTSKIWVLSINNGMYGESIDGKTVKLVLPTSAGTYNIYGTYENSISTLKEQDANIKDTSINTSNIGSNIAFLFTDTIKKPNNDINLSWATGYNTNKPFSVGSKQLYNLTTNSAISKTADTCVGIAYLDKGMLVLTNSTILSAYTASATTATTISFNSYSRKISQNVTCIANRGEFGFSSNKTFSSGDTPRISEVIFYDINKKVVAVAKTDRQISRNANQFLAIGVKFDF